MMMNAKGGIISLKPTERRDIVPFPLVVVGVGADQIVPPPSTHQVNMFHHFARGQKLFTVGSPVGVRECVCVPFHLN